MQIPMASMSSTVLLGLGRFHLAALAQSPQTAGLATAFQPTQAALAAARAAREQAEEALATPRVAARFSEFELERTIREIALLAHSADNSASGGPAFRALFPNSLDAELRPRGPAQVTASSALRERLNAQPAAVTIKARALPALDAAITGLATALAARGAAERAFGIARAAEDGARETFVAAYDSNAGAIRQLFPRQRAHQDLHFDDFRERHVAADDGDGPGQIPSAPGGGGGPGGVDSTGGAGGGITKAA